MNRKNLRSLAAGAALLLAVGVLAGCGGEKKADDVKKMVTVGIAQLVEHGALDAANKGFVAGMASQGFKENENVKLTGRTRRQTSLTCRISLSVLSSIM